MIYPTTLYFSGLPYLRVEGVPLELFWILLCRLARREL